MSTAHRPNIADLFQSGNARGLTNNKHRRLFQSLQWRQAFQHSEFYEYSLEESTLHDRSTPTIKVRQIPNGELKGLGTGTFVWPAAHILAKYFEKRFQDGSLQDKLICDIGSGTGLTGLIAGILGGKVVLTDQQCILPLLTENTESLLAMDCFSSSIPKDRFLVKEYNWDDKVPLIEQDFDYLIVSDCVLPKLYPIAILVDAIDFVVSDKTIAFFSYEHRPYPEYDPRQEFQRLCELKGMVAQVIPLSDHHSIYCAEDIEIWEVSRIGNNRNLNCSSNRCIFSTWGESKPIIPVTMDGVEFSIYQSPMEGIGGVLWPSTVVASRYILSSKFADLTKDLQASSSPSSSKLKAIDLGAGCGLTTMALHRRDFSVVATDKPILMNLLQRNIDEYLSKVEQKNDNSIEVKEFEWEKVIQVENDIIPTDINDASLVVCSDCLYDSTSVEPLLQTLELLTLDRCHVLLVNEMRTALEEFLYLARRRMGYDVTIKEIEVQQPDLELVRSSTEVKFAPPIRALIMVWSKR